MNNERVVELADIIEKALRELLDISGENNITSFIVNGHFHMFTSTREQKATSKIDIWRSGNDE